MVYISRILKVIKSFDKTLDMNGLWRTLIYEFNSSIDERRNDSLNK